MKKLSKNGKLSLLAGGIILYALSPVPAMAAGCEPGTTYTEGKGQQNVNLQFAPQVLNLNKDMNPGDVVYHSPLHSLKFTCQPIKSGSSGPALVSGDGYKGRFFSALDSANLKLQIVINGTTWTPWSNSERPEPEYLTFATPYPDDKPRTVDFPGGEIQLVLRKSLDSPVQVTIPKTDDIIRIIHRSGAFSNDYISIGTLNPTQVNLIPKCIIKTTVPEAVDLGRVITGGQGSLPSPRTFYIKTSFNEDCGGFSKVSEWTGFTLNYSIRFDVSNAEDLVPPGNTGIKLKSKADGDSLQNNGLILVIKEQGATPVAFNKWKGVDSALTNNNNPMTLPYTASLEPVQGGNITSARTGKFSQQVTVKVAYQ
ncbi:hypothetical protein E3O66_16215 [Salmonella enterica subsp. enterica serovar Oslo]|nr:hypothetical protein [Salmonella enterica subsp. enterica serovar Oslo]ECG6796646.1 hypothetical protein [Salmonella enterica subsp. enterica serovar Oslo]EGM7048165.1 hypothetical protein [Salmonella enterica subsp. enterica serovar Oslo]